MIMGAIFVGGGEAVWFWEKGAKAFQEYQRLEGWWLLWGLVSSWLSKDAKWGPWNLFLLQQKENKTTINQEDKIARTKGFSKAFKIILTERKEVIQLVNWTTKMSPKYSIINQISTEKFFSPVVLVSTMLVLLSPVADPWHPQWKLKAQPWFAVMIAATPKNTLMRLKKWSF